MEVQPLSNPEEITRLVEERIRQAGWSEEPGNEQSMDEGDHGPEGSKEQTLSSQEILEALNANEDGDARLFIELHRGRFCYDHSAGQWFKWSGHFFQEDIVEDALQSIQTIVEEYSQEFKRQAWLLLKAAKSGDQGDEKKIKKYCYLLTKRIHDLQSLKRKKDVLVLARTGHDSLGIRGDEWDRDPWLLGCLNGIIDLRTGLIRDGKIEDFIKTVAPVKYENLDQPAPAWESFLNSIFDDDIKLVGFIQRLLGYGITGLTTSHNYPIFWGKGRNGKSSLFEILKFVLGHLAYKTRSEVLLAQKFNRPSGAPDSDTIAFRGRRIVWASESDEGRRLNVSKIKELAGGDTLNARAPYGRRNVEFQPSHLLILLTNNKPHASASEYALWQRIFLVPFKFSYIDDPKEPDERKADHDLLEKLKVESSGILAWLVRGCLAWQREGLSPPDSVRLATEEYRYEEDIVGHFLEDKCKIGDQFTIQAADFYKAYRGWCEEMGHHPMSVTSFGKEMKKRFYSYTDTYVFYRGVGC
jgi:putative DNA primase/helicase